MTIITETKSLLPLVKWLGGKRRIAPRITTLFNSKKHTRLIEPFAGGGAVSFYINNPVTILNDTNPHLINLYQQVQNGLVIDITFENTRECYDAARKRFNELILSDNANNTEAAQLFYFLNKQGFNGLCRFNNKGLYNVPFGKYNKLNIKTDLIEYTNYIKDWTFTSTDFSYVETTPGDFVYCDSPYDSDVSFTKYTQQDFTWNDHIRLAEWVSTLKCSVCISNQLTPRVIDLYSKLGLTIDIFNAARTVSCNGDRIPKMEMIAYKIV